MAKILVDVDEVCADLLSEWVLRYNKDYNDELKRESIYHWDMTRSVKEECGKKIYEYLKAPDLYENIKPINGALNGVRSLRSVGHRVIYVTACEFPEMATPKMRWLYEHGFLEDIKDLVIAKDKSLIGGDIMIDDYVENLRAFGGRGILMAAPYNSTSHHGGYVVAKNWLQVPALVERALLSAV